MDAVAGIGKRCVAESGCRGHTAEAAGSVEDHTNGARVFRALHGGKERSDSQLSVKPLAGHTVAKTASAPATPTMDAQFGGLANFVSMVHRKIEDVPHDGLCGFHAVLANIQKEHTAADVARLRAVSGIATGPFNTCCLQMVADHYGRLVVVIARNGNRVRQFACAIPNFPEMLCSHEDIGDNLDEPFKSWVLRRIGNGENATTTGRIWKTFLKKPIAAATVMGALRTICENRRTVVIVHGDMHFMACTPA